MTDKEIADRFERMVLNKGANPLWHDDVVKQLKTTWPMMYQLIEDMHRIGRTTLYEGTKEETTDEA